jgi:HK97 family phage prohead protease
VARSWRAAIAITSRIAITPAHRRHHHNPRCRQHQRRIADHFAAGCCPDRFFAQFQERTMHAYRGPRPATRKFASLELRGMSGDGSFSGYASVFGEVDLGSDVIERGAFRRSIEERGAGGIRMLYQHDPAQPIGAWRTIREDARGLYVEGVLAPGVARAKEVHALLKTGALDGLSIGFQTVKAGGADRSGVRRILEADLWEISVVTFPMLPSARISDVKHARFFRDRETELARSMRRAARRLTDVRFRR